jgi:hypothetical protein
MIHSATPLNHPSSPQPTPAHPGGGDDFRPVLAARAQAPTLNPVAQHLLGTRDDDAPERQNWPPRAAVSVSELSSRAIAELSPGAPAIAPPLQSTAELPQPRPEVRNHAQQHPGPRGDAPQKPGDRLSENASPPPPQRGDADSHSSIGPKAPPSSMAPPLQSTPQPWHRRSNSPAAALQPPAAIAQTRGTREQHMANSGARQDQNPAARSPTSAGRIYRLETALQAPAPARTTASETEQETRFAAQLSRGLASVLRQGGGSLTMRLQPEALGEMTINMDLHPGRVGATFKVATHQARDLLTDNLPLLRAALEARGLDVQRLEVQLAEPAEPAEPDRGDHDHAGDAGARGGDARSRREAHDASANGGAWSSEPSPGDGWSRVQDALALMHGELRLWAQQVDAGGAPVLRMRLDAVA